jgi:hypothetical protein
MTDLERQVRERYLKRLDDRSWYPSDPSQDFGLNALPYFTAAFDQETNQSRRLRLVNVIWEFRNAAALPALAKAIRDPSEAVWKESLDGFVTIGGNSAMRMLLDARADVEKFSDAANRIEWIDEAIAQIAAGPFSPA